MRDAAGALVGRVDMLHDVTPSRLALADARRLAAERAQLLEREERRAQEEVALTRAAHAMASALTPAEIHEILLDNAHALVPACEKSAVLAADRRGMVLPAAVRGFAEETVRRMTFRTGEGVVGRVMVDRRPFICNDTLVDERVSPKITRPEGIRSFMHVPLVLGDKVYGLVSVNSSQARAFGERELKVMGELALHAASALQNALQFEQERHIAETLQEALLADELPTADGLELSALYQPAAGSQVGGDFYSAWPLEGGRLAILVGDVSGKGVEAAGLTAMVRYMAEALSQHRPGPAELVGELNDLLCTRMADGALVTLVLAVVDPVARRALLVLGRPPPARHPRRRRRLPHPRRPRPALRRVPRPGVPRLGRAVRASASCSCSTPTASSRRAARGASSARRGCATPCSRPSTSRPSASPAWSTWPRAPGAAAASPTTWPSRW